MFASIKARIADFARERRIRALSKRCHFHLTTWSWLKREAETHAEDYRRLNAERNAEDQARSPAQILRMVRAELRTARRRRDHIGVSVWTRRIAELEAQGMQNVANAASAAAAAIGSALPATKPSNEPDAPAAAATR